MAQLGSAPGLGPGCRRFKSSCPDQFYKKVGKVKATKQIEDLITLLTSAKEQYEDDLITLEELKQRVNKYIADYRAGTEIGNRQLTMPFGDHKDEKICDCPTKYLKYLLEQDWFQEKFKQHYAEVGAVLASRGELE